MLSIFAAFNFQWPSALLDIYNTLSLASFNLEFLAPECSFSVNFEAKWLVTSSLPLLLVSAVAIILLCTRLLQQFQQRVLRMVPFGATAELNLTDLCIGILITGSYYLYFRTCRGFFTGCCFPLLTRLILQKSVLPLRSAAAVL